MRQSGCPPGRRSLCGSVLLHDSPAPKGDAIDNPVGRVWVERDRSQNLGMRDLTLTRTGLPRQLMSKLAPA